MALFYFSGSIIILTIFNIIIVFLLIFSEKICNYFMNNKKKLFLSIFSLILVWRVVHLGLYPINSLIFYLVLIFTPIIFCVIDLKFQKYFRLKDDK